jgi:hypothetical protein
MKRKREIPVIISRTYMSRLDVSRIMGRLSVFRIQGEIPDPVSQ